MRGYFYNIRLVLYIFSWFLSRIRNRERIHYLTRPFDVHSRRVGCPELRFSIWNHIRKLTRRTRTPPLRVSPLVVFSSTRYRRRVALPLVCSLISLFIQSVFWQYTCLYPDWNQQNQYATRHCRLLKLMEIDRCFSGEGTCGNMRKSMWLQSRAAELSNFGAQISMGLEFIAVLQNYMKHSS